MVAQRNELVTQQFNFAPTTLKEAQEYATIFAGSGLCPESYRGRPNDILIVWQMGKELGLDKMQSLRTLGCINGMPFAYGDGLLALIKHHPDFVDMREWFEGSIKDNTLTAFCTMTRKDQAPITQSFSIEDAKLAGLWQKRGKNGGSTPWITYPKRMLQHRARGFAAKDTFPDALYGLMSQEEAESVIDSTPKIVPMPDIKSQGMKGLEEALGIQDEVIEGELVQDVVKEPLELSKLDELKELISTRKVKPTSITATLKGFGVANIDELTDEMIDKWSNHLKTKGAK